MKSELKADSKRRLNRIAGQVTGLQKMVDEERPCAETSSRLLPRERP